MEREDLSNFIEMLVSLPNGVESFQSQILDMAFSGKLLKGNLRQTESWKTQKLIDVCDYIQRGMSPAYAVEGEIKVVSQKCVQWRGFLPDHSRFIDSSTTKKYSEDRFLRNSDILWNSTGTGTVGRTCLFHSQEGEVKYVADSHVTVVRSSKLDPKFLLYWTKSPKVQQKVLSLTTGTTNQQELNLTTIKTLEISFPNLEDQVTLSNHIERLFKLCEELSDQIRECQDLSSSARKSALNAISSAQTSEELKNAWKRVQNNWEVMVGTAEGISDLRSLIETLGIRGQLTEKLESAETAEDLLKSLDLDAGVSIKEDSEFVPRNWVMTNLGSIIKLEYGKSLPKQSRSPLGKVPVYGSNGVVGYHDAALIESDAIVVGRKGSIGQVNIANGKSWVIDTAYYVTPQANMALDYVALLIKTCKLETLNKATAIPGLNRNDAYAQRCFLAPPEEQNRIMQTVNALLDICNLLESALQERDKLALKFSRSVVSAST